MRPLVIGIGNRWRSDDGIGVRTIDALEALGTRDADLLRLDGEPTRIVAAWAGRQCVVVIDAIRTGVPPGTVHHLEVDQIPDVTSEASSHGGGVPAAVALGRALDALPDRIVVLGVEPASVDHGDELSPPVASSLDVVVRRVVEEVTAACA